MNINKVVFAGNLTRDPELKSLPSGMSVCNFSVASNRVWKDKDGNKQEDTEFANIVAFDKRGEAIATYLKKGDPVYLEGRMQTRSWEADGQKKYRTEIVMTDFQFLGTKSNGESTGANTEVQSNEENPDDIPF